MARIRVHFLDCSPYTASQVDRLEAVQKTFLRLVSVRLGWQYGDVPLELLADELDMHPLKLSIGVSNVATLHKIITSHHSCPVLLADLFENNCI